jgi:WW domain-containing oxidoreductase
VTKPLGSKSTAEEALGGRDLSGLNVIVTGATSGLGTETTRVLAQAGAHVIMAVRKPELGREIAEGLGRGLPKSAGGIEVLPLDLADLVSVRGFAAAFLASGRSLDLLINNAGIMAVPEGKTKQGFELQVGTNHLGHFALTKALLPALAAAPSARVVSLSSAAHRQASPQRLVASLSGKPIRYSPFGVYGDSKLANILFVKALARRLPSSVEAFALHPGVIATNLFQAKGLAGAAFKVVSKTFGFLFMKTVPQGAATSVYAATAPELSGHSGAYLSNCAIAVPKAYALDEALAEEVWTLSERCVA